MENEPDQRPGISWLLLGCLALVAFIAGAFGYREHFAAISGNYNAPLTDLLYSAFCLFTLNFEGDHTTPKPFLLELARWLAPLVVSAGAFQLLHSVIREQQHAYRIRRLRGHYIVCGDHAGAEILARQLSAEGKPVILVGALASQPEGEAGKKDRLLHLPQNPDLAGVLERARLSRAKCLIAAMQDDRRNVAITITALGLCADLDLTLEIFTHVGDSGFRDLLQRNELLANQEGARVQLRAFSHYQNLARSIWAGVPLEVLHGTGRPAASVHVVLPHLSQTGVALAIQTARLGHYRNMLPVSVHAVAVNAEMEVAELKHIYPGIVHCCRMEAHGLRSALEFAQEVTRIASAAGANASVAVFTSFENAQDGLRQAMMVAELLPAHPGLRLFLAQEQQSMAQILARQFPNLAFGVLPGEGDTFGVDAVLRYGFDQVARRIHDAWLAEERLAFEANPQRKVKATFKPWAELTEQQKDASRSQAEHIPVKLRAAGLSVESAPDSWPAVIADSALVEQLAEMEHNRWCADKWLDNWSYAADRSDERKEHPDLVPYEQLSEAVKQYDRDTILKLSRYLS